MSALPAQNIAAGSIYIYSISSNFKARQYTAKYMVTASGKGLKYMWTLIQSEIEMEGKTFVYA